MATRETSGGKVKRGTSPSGHLIKKSPSSSSSYPAEENPASPTDDKHVPSYLRPTKSSLPRKSVSDSSAQKPGLNRRRSFDRPPPAAQVQKAIRNVSAVREIKPLRSSSFSPKTGTSSSSTRPTSEKIYTRISSGVKDSRKEPRLSKSRSPKKSTLSSTGAKKEYNGTPSSSAKKKASQKVTSKLSDSDIPTADQLANEDDLVNIDSEVQSLPEISEMPGDCKELGDPSMIDVEVKPSEDVQDNAVIDEGKHDHEEKSEAFDQIAEETVEQQSVTPGLHQEEKEEQIVETKLDQENVEESAAADQPEVEAANEEVIAEHSETLAEEKNEEATVEQEAEKGTKDTEPKDETQSDAIPAVEAAAASAKQQSTAGKKDKQDYNDVIEKTINSNKGRKNKVLALAGAFETVITLDKS